jgi:hypothetical protein
MFLPAIEEKKKRESVKERKEVLLPLPDYRQEYEEWKRKNEEKKDSVIHIQII